MQSFEYIKHALRIYIISGILLGIAIFALLMTHKYSNHAIARLKVMHEIKTGKDRVIHQIANRQTVLRYLREDLKLDSHDTYSELSFFQRLDDIKTNMRNSSITVAKFEEAEGQRILPVQIAVPVKNYKMLVEYAGYIESFSIPPVYRIQSFSIVKDQQGNVTLNIQGALKAPLMSSP